MANEDVSELVKTIIQTQVIQALNSAPDAIEKLVKAALSRPVDSVGKFDGYSGNKMPYLDYVVGEEIRSAATTAVRKVMQDQAGKIEALVREGLSSESVIAAVTKSFIHAASQEYKINVSFEAEPKRSY